MKHPYELGSIWKRRDGKRAVVVSEIRNGQVRAHVADEPNEKPYLVYANFGHVSRNMNNSPMDLIYRDEDDIDETAPDGRAAIDP